MSCRTKASTSPAWRAALNRRSKPMVDAVLLDMARPQLDPAPWAGYTSTLSGRISKPRGEALVQAGRRALAPEVRPPDIADEQGIPGQDEPRLVTAGRVGHEKADTVGRMPRRVDDLERNRSHAQLLAVLDGGVGEGRLGRGMDVDARPGLGGEGLVARDVVGVQVGLHDMGDRRGPSFGSEPGTRRPGPVRDRSPRPRRRVHSRSGTRDSRSPR